MKVKVISRHPDEYQRETKLDIFKAPRNYAAPLDPFRHQVEYTRALNAAKLERVFAKPFLAAFDGHNEAVHLLAKHPSRLSTVLSGARDGQLKVWQLPTRQCVRTLQAHTGPINGLSVCAVHDTSSFSSSSISSSFAVSVGQDAQLKLWTLTDADFDATRNTRVGVDAEPTHSVALSGVPHGVSHVADSTDFVTCGEGISVWRMYRNSPIRHYDVGPNTVQHVKCNPIEESIVAGCASDRSIFLLDARQKVPLNRVVLQLRTNSIAWHPLESFTFVAANEDYNLYTFDMRKLSSARNVHQGHTAAVMDVDFAPSGQEFVSGGFDRSLRIFPTEQWRSREVYHTARMQYVLSVLWSLDNKYVLSGSDDMNIRLWKANAADKLGPLCPREKAALEYSQKLRETYQNHPEVRRIVKHRHVPKAIFSAAREHRTIRESQRRKDKNRRANTKSAAAEPHESERAKPVVKQGME